MLTALLRKHHRKIFLLAMAILPAIAGFLFFSGLRVPCLVLEIPATGAIVWAAPLGRDESFQLCYIHSVDLLPVYETYTCKDMRLVLAGTRFLSWGAGLGFMGEGILSEKNGWTIIKDMQRQVGTIPLRVGTIAEHTLLYRGESIRLRDYVPPQTLVHIRMKKLFLFD